MIRSRPPARSSPAMKPMIKPAPPDDGARNIASSPVPRPKRRIPRNISLSWRAGDFTVNWLSPLKDQMLNNSCGGHSIAGRVGFEPTICGSAGRRLGPGSTTGPRALN